MSDSTEHPTTANDRFKRQHRRIRWIAIGLAVLAHVVLLLFTPVFQVDFGQANASGPRLTITFEEWSAPSCGADCRRGYIPYDTSNPPPQLRNGGDLNRRLSRLYPYAMWRHREPSSATYLVLINRAGRVHEARVLEPSGDAAEDVLGFLTGNARFELGASTAATVRINVEVP